MLAQFAFLRASDVANRTRIQRPASVLCGLIPGIPALASARIVPFAVRVYDPAVGSASVLVLSKFLQ